MRATTVGPAKRHLLILASLFKKTCLHGGHRREVFCFNESSFFRGLDVCKRRTTRIIDIQTYTL